jgi:hypothetical protein
VASKGQISRINHILEFIKKNGGIVNEFNVKAQFKLGPSTYQQLKREVRLDPMFNQTIEILSNRGSADQWKYKAVEEIFL